MIRLTVLLGFVALAAAAPPVTPSERAPTFESLARPFLHKHCLSCHGAEKRKGDIAFHELTGVQASNAGVWKQIWEQVALKEMPPRRRGAQPTAMERLRLSDWIVGELERVMKDQGGFDAHLRPAKGNYLDHELLFGKLPEGLEPASTPARLWRVHPQEHLTRLNEMINHEPAYNPRWPGKRAHGDHIPENRDGEVKVFFGFDRVIGWVGGSAAIQAAVTGFPAVLTTIDDHGLQNYAVLYSVNGAEAEQIARTAEDILRFMANGPDAEPYQFADRVADIDKKYKHESVRGLPQSLFYSRKPARPLTPVYDLMHARMFFSVASGAAVDYLFEALTCRPPTDKEARAYVALLKKAIDDLGKKEGIVLGLTPIFLDRDALFRPELAAYGTPDSHGRVMLQGQELALAINAAFSYIPPDKALKQAVAEGRLKTREDVKREVARILDDDSIRKPRVLQFFREYFDYYRAGRICKDMAALRSAGGNPKEHYHAMFAMTASTDRLVELILQEDKNVLYELLTTNRVVVDQETAGYFGAFNRPGALPKFRPPAGKSIHVRTERVHARVFKKLTQPRTLTTLPAEQRMGILTHPSWLVSHSDAMDNHAILRGRWIRERLLGGAIPDVPITVDAMLPDEPQNTLRQRMRVTRESYCWKCHQKMDPLGLPFERYNHIGLFRKIEKGKPVDTSGEIIASGEPALDGPVNDPFEMIQKLARSERVKQVFVRHAFRYWLGRNETINDAPTLQAAYKAYHDSNGSMKALIASLLTSDSFLYRKRR